MQFDFEHYLKAGHGRAYLMAQKEPEKYREIILKACRKDYTFDMQCEGSRAFFTADLIDLFEEPAPFIEAAKESFKSPDIDDVKNEVQYLSDLLIEYGQRKTVLNKYFSLWKKIKDTPYSHLMERSSHLLSNVEYLAIKLVSDKTWKVAGNIGKDRSFSPENARHLRGIASCAIFDGIFFFAGNAVLLLTDNSHPGIALFSLLIVFACFALGIAAGSSV